MCICQGAHAHCQSFSLIETAQNPRVKRPPTHTGTAYAASRARPYTNICSVSESWRRHQKHSAIFRALLEALLMLRERKKKESVMDVLNCHNVSVYRDIHSLYHTHTHTPTCSPPAVPVCYSRLRAGPVGWGGESHTLSGTPIGREKSCSSLHHRLHNSLETKSHISFSPTGERY